MPKKTWYPGKKSAFPASGWKIPASALMVAIVATLIAGCSEQPAPKNDAAMPADAQGTDAGAQDAKMPGGLPVEEPAVTEVANTADSRSGYDKIAQTVAAVADGIYERQARYTYHKGLSTEGVETVDFKVTVKGDVITGVSVTAENPVPISKKIIGSFSDALPGLVVGKKITEVKMAKNVAGSSLTSAAFQLHIDDIVAGKAK